MADSFIICDVTIGAGGWFVRKTVKLAACPHVGDYILAGEESVACDSVTIGETEVFVRNKSRFANEEEMEPYLKTGWRR